jgi:hypothetical protein
MTAGPKLNVWAISGAATDIFTLSTKFMELAKNRTAMISQRFLPTTASPPCMLSYAAGYKIALRGRTGIHVQRVFIWDIQNNPATPA